MAEAASFSGTDIGPRRAPRYDATATMRANRSVDTGPEILLRRALFGAGLRGYRVHRRVEGARPDIAYIGRKVVVLVHGCFWHDCPKCRRPRPKTNVAFWENKLSGNKRRDKLSCGALEAAGWAVVVIWECEIRTDIAQCVTRVRRRLVEHRTPLNLRNRRTRAASVDRVPRTSTRVALPGRRPGY